MAYDDLVPPDLIAVPDMLRALVAKLHGWEWTAPVRVISDGESFSVKSLAPGGDGHHALALHQEAAELLAHVASRGGLVLQFADGFGLQQWFFDIDAGRKSVALGCLSVDLTGSPVRKGQPLYARADAFANFLAKLQVVKGSDGREGAPSVPVLTAPNEQELEPPAAAALAGPHKSGGVGRPTSRHLVEAEMKRRHNNGLMLTTLQAEAEAEALATWLREDHPTEPRLTAKAIKNSLRQHYRSFRADGPK
jgi:hypothetical protein